MNYESPNHERGLLRRQLKDDLVNHFRARDAAERPDPAALVIKALVCQFLAGRRSLGDGGPTPEEIAQKIYGKQARIRLAFCCSTPACAMSAAEA